MRIAELLALVTDGPVGVAIEGVPGVGKPASGTMPWTLRWLGLPGASCDMPWSFRVPMTQAGFPLRRR